MVTARPRVSTLVGIFSPVCGMHGHIVMKVITITHYQVCDTDDTFKVMGSEIKVANIIFRKCTFPAEAYRLMVLFQFQLNPMSVYSITTLQLANLSICINLNLFGVQWMKVF